MVGRDTRLEFKFQIDFLPLKRNLRVREEKRNNLQNLRFRFQGPLRGVKYYAKFQPLALATDCGP